MYVLKARKPCTPHLQSRLRPVDPKQVQNRQGALLLCSMWSPKRGPHYRQRVHKVRRVCARQLSQSASPWRAKSDSSWGSSAGSSYAPDRIKIPTPLLSGMTRKSVFGPTGCSWFGACPTPAAPARGRACVRPPPTTKMAASGPSSLIALPQSAACGTGRALWRTARDARAYARVP